MNEFVTINTLEEIHYQCRGFIEAKDFEALKNYIDTFNSAESFTSELKTILVITKAFKENEIIKESRKNILVLLNSRLV